MSGFVYNTARLHMSTEEAIEALERINNCKFSEQQLQILNSKNGIKIVACAGSGKTFSLVNLVVKRILTGEIEDPSKLLMTTYSKAGAVNMTDRINDLLVRAGYPNLKVEVRTIHSLCYSILDRLGMIRNITTNRLGMIRQAVKNCQLPIEEDDLSSLDNLFSYQVNNMLSNEALFKSYVFDLDIKLEDYETVIKEFARLKKEADEMDFDDLQLIVFQLLYVLKRQDVIDYLHYSYRDIYVDELQDTSAIQYKIIQKIITDDKHVVFVGDDDQCLMPGTVLQMEKGEKNIEDVAAGDIVKCCHGHSDIGSGLVESVKETHVLNREVYTITTDIGNVVTATGNHVFFVWQHQIDGGLNNNVYVLFGADDVSEGSGGLNGEPAGDKQHHSICRVKTETGYENITHVSGDSLFEYFARNTDIDDSGLYAKLLSYDAFKYIQVADLMVGMYLCSYKDNMLYLAKITDIKKESYTGKVYDVNVREYRNYIANNIVVHNCIYGWRGAKADLLLNADVDYHIDKINLDTNYRCTDTILNFAKTGIEYMSRREAKDMKSAKTGGKVEFMCCNSRDLYDMSVQTANKIEKMIKEDHVLPSDICVLVRYNAHALVLSQLLMLKDIYCNFGDDMKITYQTIYKDIQSLVELCGSLDSGSYDRASCSAVLWKMVSYMGAKNSGLISEFMQHTGCDLSDALAWILAEVFHQFDYTGNITVNAQFKARMSNSFRRFSSDTIIGLESVYRLLTNHDLTERLVGLMCLYRTGTEFMLKRINKRRNFTAAFSFFHKLAKDLGFEAFKAWMTKIKVYENCNPDLLGRTVKLSTIHSSKGLEWKHVILLAYDNISFPDVDYMVSKEKISSVDMQAYIDGERRLAYVAATRAIDTLTVVTDNQNTSLFALEELGACAKGWNGVDYLNFAQFIVSHGYKTRSAVKIPELIDSSSYNVKEDEKDVELSISNGQEEV